jgi:hypothetical protein
MTKPMLRPGLQEGPGPGDQQPLNQCSEFWPQSRPPRPRQWSPQSPNAQPELMLTSATCPSAAIRWEKPLIGSEPPGRSRGSCRPARHLQCTVPPPYLRQRSCNLVGAPQAVSLGMKSEATTKTLYTSQISGTARPAAQRTLQAIRSHPTHEGEEAEYGASGWGQHGRRKGASAGARPRPSLK